MTVLYAVDGKTWCIHTIEEPCISRRGVFCRIWLGQARGTYEGAKGWTEPMTLFRSECGGSTWGVPHCTQVGFVAGSHGPGECGGLGS